MDEKTQKLIDREVKKAQSEQKKLVLGAIKDAAPDTDGLEKSAAKAVKDHHKSVTSAVKESLAA